MAVAVGSAAGRDAGQAIDVFISYSNADVGHAERLQAALTARGIKVFRDKAGARPDANATGLTPGQHVDFALPAALREAKAVVVLWSANSIASAWVAREAHYAAVEGKLATLHIAPFEPKEIPGIFAPFHSESLADTLANPANLLRRLAELNDPAVRSRLRRIDISRLPTTYATRLFGRETEMADLNKAWDSAAGADKTNVLVLDAMGGTGKTALVNHFVQGLAAEGWRGAEAVFVWSFYSQGTDEKRQASADDFFKTALAWFGHAGEAPASQHDKGVRLAELIAAKRALVILDGLEPLQYGPARRAGGTGDAGVTGNLKDQGLRAMLRQLAASNPGLVIVTTRLRVPDLAGRPAPAVITERLGPIPTMAGVELIRSIGVRGKYEELKALVEDLSGHAIALTQVATWLVNFRHGDVRCRDELPSLVDLGGDNERDPFRVMLAYETQFKRQIAEQLEKGQKLGDIAAAKQLALLFLMGLFDRPMERGDREALLAAPAIPGLTDGLVGLTPRQIDYAVQSLRDLGLLLPKDDGTPTDLDAHPLVREYFGARLEKERPEAWREAHERLYDYYRFRGLPEVFRVPEAYGLLAYKVSYPDAPMERRIEQALKGELTADNAPNVPPSIRDADPSRLRAAAKLVDGPDWRAGLAAFLPETEEAMAPLFAAIAHGCAAGRDDETFNEVYWPRIVRGDEKFATRKMGLFGSDLAAIAHFFAEPFTVPAAGLLLSDQAIVLAEVGVRLRALGRLAEAVEPMRVGAKLQADREDWSNAAIGYSNLSELLVTLGRLSDDAARGEAGAVATGAQSVVYADRSGDAFNRMSKRTTHADALLQAGTWAVAARRFAEAEAMQRKGQRELPLLYSWQGYKWCDLKLAQGRSAEVAARAEYALELVLQGSRSLLDIALNTLSLGRVAHLAKLATSPRPRGEGRGLPQVVAHSAAAQLDTAVERLRASGNTDDLPRGLLARAAYHRDAGNDKLASKDLTEAFEIAERGGMRLFLANCWLESARQRLAQPDPAAALLTAAANAIDRAAAIVAETGYHRRDPDLALVRAELALAEGDAAGARPHLDDLIAAMRAHDLWSFLFELVRLAERHSLADLAPTLADLADERARFDAAADTAFEAARKPGETADGSGIDPDSIPDELVDQMLVRADFRKALDEALAHSGNPKLADLDADRQREYARAMIAALTQAENQRDAGDEPNRAPAETAAPPEPTERAPQQHPPPPRAAQPQSAPAERNSGLLRRMFGPFMRRKS